MSRKQSIYTRGTKTLKWKFKGLPKKKKEEKFYVYMHKLSSLAGKINSSVSLSWRPKTQLVAYTSNKTDYLPLLLHLL